MDFSDWGESHIWDWKGFQCHWRVLGEPNSRPIVLVHGFGASSNHWRHNAKVFAKDGYRVFGLDLIGFGSSSQPKPDPRNPLDNYFWAKQIVAFLEEIVKPKSSGPSVLIGNSLGSLAAITTVAFRPDLVAAVIAAPLPDPAIMTPLAKQTASPLCQKIKKKFITVFFHLIPLELIVFFISKTFLIKTGLQMAYSKSIQGDKELHRLITQPARRPTAPRALRSMCIGMTLRRREHTAPLLLQKIAQAVIRPPILLIWGKEDRLVPLFIGHTIVGMHPWLKLLVIDSCGHCPHDELPDEFNKTVLNWLKSNLIGDPRLA
ncbi:alpha/beta fold hydrolase [Prochlorococcus sp. MIT 1300]|uniref:alpha/beta fold hydrolase n=1 Tax=Prochlorococcus sp. MIT 1300 TaxID=3096218 RepID=UPI002A755D41|nr:alpha/beta fold hydrolase [Prochlorococcus sp. MIT 1300]